MKVLIVDDEKLARQRLSRMLDAMPEVERTTECGDGEEAIAALRNNPYDLVLLDIRLRGLNGFEVMDAVGPDRMPPVVFVTAYDEFAVRAFEVHAMDYLLKPVSPERLRETVDRIRSERGAPHPDPASLTERLESGAANAGIRWLMIRNAGEARILPVSDIELFEAAGNEVYVHHGGDRFLHRESLHSLQARLDPRQFIRIHRSTMVNLAYVRSVEPIAAGDYRIRLHDGRPVRLSRTYRASFMEALDLS